MLNEIPSIGNTADNVQRAVPLAEHGIRSDDADQGLVTDQRHSDVALTYRREGVGLDANFVTPVKMDVIWVEVEEFATLLGVSHGDRYHPGVWVRDRFWRFVPFVNLIDES